MGYAKLISRLIESVMIFHGLSPQQVSEVLTLSHAISLEPGEVILNQGDTGTSMYVITSGELSVFDQYEAGIGGTRIGKLFPGESFGEMAFLNKGKRCASVVADTPGNVIEIRKGAITGDIAATLYGNIARMLSERLAEANLIMSLSLESRVSHLDTGTFQAAKLTVRKSS